MAKNAETTVPKVRSFSDAAKEAGLPVVVDRDFIGDLGPVTWLSARSATARNPQTGQMGNGLMVEIITDEGDKYLSFIGNVALLQVLGEVDSSNELHEEENQYFVERKGILPFRAAIHKSGRTWVFADN